MKNPIRKFLARVFYWLGLDELFYFLNRKSKRILTFHNVLPDSMCAEVPHVGVSMSQGEFESIINEVARKFAFSTDIDDPSTVTVTFDDGTLNEYEVAGRFLMQKRIPAILFVAGDIIGATEKTILRVEQLCVWSQFVPIEIAQSAFGEFSTREELWVRYVQPGYRRDAATRGERFLEQINGIYPMEKILETLPREWRRLRLTGVTQNQLEDLRQAGWLIGWHTKSHFPLGFLSPDQRREELDCGPSLREVVLGYPYGDIASVGEETPTLAKEMGYPAAVSNFSGGSPYYGRHFMMRMAPANDKYELHFLLSGAKYFVQNRQLLPHHGNA